MPDLIFGDKPGNMADDDSDDEIQRPGRPRKAVLNDSSDEDDDVLFKKGFLSLTPDKNGTKAKSDLSDQDDTENEAVISKKPVNRLKKLLDDEDSQPSRMKPGKGLSDWQMKENGSKHSDSDSDTSVKSASQVSNRKSGVSSSSRRSGSDSDSDSDSSSADEDDDGGISLDAIRSKIINKHLPSKSARVLNELPNGDPERRKKSNPPKEKVPSRKAKEAALAEIHSETQRMIRERKVSLPYHRPKQRSLEDFLNRRKLAPTVALKTTSDELAKVWKHVEERERMAESFYKSESEEESDNDYAYREASNKLTSDRASQSVTSLTSQSVTTLTSQSATTLTSQSATTVNERVTENSGNTDVASNNSIDSEKPTPALRIFPDPDSEEFPRLQLSEVLTQPDSACDTADISNSVPDINSLENSETGADIILKAVPVTTDEKSERSPVGDANVDVKLDSNPRATSDFVVLDDEENSLSLSEKVVNEMSNSCSLSEKINRINLPIAKNPKISGGPDEIIDLDELTTKPGAFGLMQRFMKHAKLKQNKAGQQTHISVTCSEVNDCGDVINITRETINVKKDDQQKPGEKLVVLKTTLQQKIAENRNLQLAKRIEEYKLYEEEFYGGTSDNELEELLGDDTCKENNADKEGFEEVADHENEDPAEDIVDSEEEEIEEAKDKDNPFLDEEADESEQEVAEKEERNESDIEETASVIFGDEDKSDSEKEGSESSQSSEDEEEETLSVPPMPSGLRSLAGTQNANDAFGESQLAALCSGDFSSAPVDHKNVEDSSIPVSNELDDIDDVDQEAALTADSDDEEILGKKKSVNRKRKLSFSDEEDDDALVNKDDRVESDAHIKDGDDRDEDKEEEEKEELGADVDSEQELALVDDEDDEEIQLAKKLSKGFLEKEAELSESDWGSDDEDERGLDRYEEEEGDKDKISQRRLQKELGKIHMREVLAEDSREVRILQELLLEDGDLHSDGPKRQRLFRWYNQDEDNANEKRSLDFGENGNENEEEDEVAWRRQRLERENFLRKKKIDNLEPEIVDSPVAFNDTRKGVKVTPKVTPTVPKSPDVKSNFSIFAKRGSFLGRGEKMLSKLAEITNNVGSKENPVGNSRNNRNMVFSALSPPKDAPAEDSKIEIPMKRKGEFLATSVVKKIKFNNSNGKTKVSALEQLKLSEG